MPDFKGAGVIVIRSQLRSKAENLEGQLLAALNDSERQCHDRLVATDWVPIGFATRYFELAAPLIHGKQPDALRLTGRDLARENLRGTYRHIVRVLSVPTVIAQTARFWDTFHRRGRCRVEQREPGSVSLVIEDYPELPERFREFLCGWILGAAELTGCKDASVVKFDNHPNAWRFAIRWRV